MILTSIQSFARNQKLLFVIFILLQILAIISTQYAYLDNMQRENDWLIYVDEATLFKVEFYEKVNMFQINDTIQNIRDKYGEKLTAISIDLDNDNLRAYYFGQNKVINYGKTNISSNDIIVSTNANVSNCMQLGDVFETPFRNFNVVALRTDVPYNEILLEAVSEKYNIKTINITLSFLPTISQRKEFTEYLQEIFTNANIIEPESRSLYTESKFSSELVSTIFLLILTVINIVFIFKYVILKRKNSYIISRLCGASQTQIFFILLSEYFIYCVTSCILATFITKIIIIPIFYNGSFFTWHTLLLPVCAFMVMCILIILPLIIKNCKLHMIENKGGK